MSKAVCKQVMALVQLPLCHHNNIMTVLELEHFANVVSHFPVESRKEFGLIVCENVIDHNTLLDDPDVVCLQPHLHSSRFVPSMF